MPATSVVDTIAWITSKTFNFHICLRKVEVWVMITSMANSKEAHLNLGKLTMLRFKKKNKSRIK